jgi:hypothetical protein
MLKAIASSGFLPQIHSPSQSQLSNRGQSDKIFTPFQRFFPLHCCFHEMIYNLRCLAAELCKNELSIIVSGIRKIGVAACNE